MAVRQGTHECALCTWIATVFATGGRPALSRFTVLSGGVRHGAVDQTQQL